MFCSIFILLNFLIGLKSFQPQSKGDCPGGPREPTAGNRGRTGPTFPPSPPRKQEVFTTPGVPGSPRLVEGQQTQGCLGAHLSPKPHSHPSPTSPHSRGLLGGCGRDTCRPGAGSHLVRVVNPRAPSVQRQPSAPGSGDAARVSGCRVGERGARTPGSPPAHRPSPAPAPAAAGGGGGRCPAESGKPGGHEPDHTVSAAPSSETSGGLSGFAARFF